MPSVESDAELTADEPTSRADDLVEATVDADDAGDQIVDEVVVDDRRTDDDGDEVVDEIVDEAVVRRRRRGPADEVVVEEPSPSTRGRADESSDRSHDRRRTSRSIDEDDLLEEQAPPAESPYDRPGRWFVVHTQSGYEKKVKQNLEARISSMNMEERIHEVVIPMEDVVEFKNGKKVVVQKKVFPGYLLVRCELDDDSWYVIRNTPGVTGFVGQGAKPSPLPRRDVETFLQVKAEGEEATRSAASPASSTSWARRSGSRKAPSPTSPARSSRSTRTSSRSRCSSTSSAGRPRSSSSSARSPSSSCPAGRVQTGRLVRPPERQALVAAEAPAS